MLSHSKVHFLLYTPITPFMHCYTLTFRWIVAIFCETFLPTIQFFFQFCSLGFHWRDTSEWQLWTSLSVRANLMLATECHVQRRASPPAGDKSWGWQMRFAVTTASPTPPCVTCTSQPALKGPSWHTRGPAPRNNWHRRWSDEGRQSVPTSTVRMLQAHPSADQMGTFTSTHCTPWYNSRLVLWLWV